MAKALLTSGPRLDLLIGVAGSGKTTPWRRCGPASKRPAIPSSVAATSGQAAKALGEGAGVNSADGGLAHLAARAPAPGP